MRNDERIRLCFRVAPEITVRGLVKYAKIPEHEAWEVVKKDWEDTVQARNNFATMSDVYHRLAGSLSNRGMMRNVIGRDLGYLSKPLARFNPRAVVQRYGTDEKLLLGAILEAKPGFAGKPVGKRSLWKVFAAGCLDGAHFLSEFKSVHDFYQYLDKWKAHPDIACALPLFLSRSGIRGLGPALAADFFKGLGVTSMVKPDVWIRRLLLVGGFIRDENVAEVVIFRFFHYASHVMSSRRYPPAVLDRILWQLGSGRFSSLENYKRALPGQKQRLAEFGRAMASIQPI